MDVREGIPKGYVGEGGEATRRVALGGVALENSIN